MSKKSSIDIFEQSKREWNIPGFLGYCRLPIKQPKKKK